MKIYEKVESERERIEKCISRFGWTSDHNLDWWIDSIIDETAKPIFVEFDDGTGLLTHKYPDKWRIWSDPLAKPNDASQKILEFSKFILVGGIKEVWCDDVSDKIYPALESEISSIVEKQSILKSGAYPELKNNNSLKLNDIYYSLLWPVLDITKYDSSLSGGHFKEIRNAKNKFYREHELKILNFRDLAKKDLYKIIDDWRKEVARKQKEDIYDLRYRKAIENGFRGFSTARVLVVDGRPAGINAGYEVPNHAGRFAGIIGIHDYSVKDLGIISWLEDLDWIKNAGYKELDMQGTEYEWELKVKTQYGAVIERKTDTFSIQR